MPFVSKARLKDLMFAGAQMANICYNLAQVNEIDPRWRISMSEAQKKWDNARVLLQEPVPPK